MASAATLVDAWLARRTASEPALRGRRAESAHRLRLFRLRRVRVVVGRFRAAGAGACRRCRWSVGGTLLAVLHFVARRRLPAVKRTAALPGLSASKVKTVPPAALRIHSAATRPNPAASHLIPAPFRRSHTAKANPLRGIASQKQTRSALRVRWHKAASVLAALYCTPPGRGKSQAIEHNRALPKVGQSLRIASLGGLPLRALRVRVMVGYVLRPSLDKGYVGVAIAALGSSGAARGWGGSLPRRRARGAGRRCRWSVGGESRRWWVGNCQAINYTTVLARC